MPSDRRRLFFAIWPPPPLAAALARFAESNLDGRALPLGALHLTLAFAGEVDARQQRVLETAAGAIEDIPAFELVLDRCGSFRRAGVAWVGPENVPPALAELALRLREAVATTTGRCTPGFRAHVTVGRRASWSRRVAAPGWRWWIPRFGLTLSTLSERGPTYRVLRRWPLRQESAS